MTGATSAADGMGAAAAAAALAAEASAAMEAEAQLGNLNLGVQTRRTAEAAESALRDVREKLERELRVRNERMLAAVREHRAALNTDRELTVTRSPGTAGLLTPSPSRGRRKSRRG